MMQTPDGTIRRDALQKIEGSAKYNDDYSSPACLHSRLLTSVYAHAEIKSIDLSCAYSVPGVRAVVTGESGAMLGSVIADMPALAVGKVRYFGEPVAIVVAEEEWQAAQAAKQIKVEYTPLPLVNTLDDALTGGAALVHPELAQYKHVVNNVYPEYGTNIANRTRIRKGSMEEGWSKSEVIVEATYHIPQASHAYMETRNARARVSPDGRIDIYSASQGPHASRALIAKALNIAEGNIVIHTPFLGGAYGGKVNPHIDFLAYMASKAAGGRETRLSLTREENFYSTPCKIGAKAVVKLGADKSGKLQALKTDFFIDCGAYSDTAPVMARAAAASCGGAYNIPCIECDSICVYTNHVYTTSFRGFGHDVSTFVIERTMEKLATALEMDGAKLRSINALREGNYTPTQVKVTLNNTGDISACIDRLKQIMEWDKGTRFQVDRGLVRSKGMACFSKTSSSPTDVVSTAVVTFCSDGSVNLSCGVVECGTGATTALPKILAKRLNISVKNIFVNIEVDTQSNPEHWKTVASMSTYMAGNAIIAAADDAISQIKANAALALRCGVKDVEFDGKKAYLIEDPDSFIELKNLVYGVKTAQGAALGGPVIGRGHFNMKNLSVMDPETGKGKTGPYWTMGAQAVEVEYDQSEHSFRLVKAATVLDAGSLVDLGCAAGQVAGAMNMGLSNATREEYRYANNGEPQYTSFRTYKVMHYGQNPEYVVEFVETPNLGGPYGLRGLGEHGILGMAPALANALFKAAGVELDSLPITFETLWGAAMNKGKPVKQ